jgi:CubicO group peptidase (beta-lactamase class C family)
VVAKDGRLIAERYALGVSADAPLLSWSMAKSVIMALVGTLVLEGRLDVAAPAPVPEWRGPGGPRAEWRGAGDPRGAITRDPRGAITRDPRGAITRDPRGAITLDQLLRQSSGLAFDETYGAVNDVSRMLFTRPDTGAFAAAFPLAHAPGTVWSYSSGTSNVVARIVRDAFGGDSAAMVRHARERLFDPAGMTSAVFELDASGSFIGSSFAYMTARDWARFAELFRNDGVWQGRRLLPEGWARYATTPTPAAPRGEYGAHWWLNAGAPGAHQRRDWPLVPPDLYAARGHSGQRVVVVPSAGLVVVRLGLTVPDEDDDGTQELVAELLAALDPTAGRRGSDAAR